MVLTKFFHRTKMKFRVANFSKTVCSIRANVPKTDLDLEDDEDLYPANDPKASLNLNKYILQVFPKLIQSFTKDVHKPNSDVLMLVSRR